MHGLNCLALKRESTISSVGLDGGQKTLELRAFRYPSSENCQVCEDVRTQLLHHLFVPLAHLIGNGCGL